MGRLIVARYALVQWPDKDDPPHGPPRYPPCCITLESVEAALQRGAIVLGREDAILEEAIPTFNSPRLTDDDAA
jgi:hypothetical protein